MARPSSIIRCSAVRALTATLLLALIACSRGTNSGSGLLITGAGATFPYPLYTTWFQTYGQLHPELRFNYQSIGSGGGIRQMEARTVDFGATDMAVDDAGLARMRGGVLHIPTVLGAVAIAYNDPAIGPGLKLTGFVIADIFLGTVARWNDPALAALNPGRALPDLPILVVHRSDGSGTTGIFTDFLAKKSPAWKARVGAGPAVSWPAGLGAKGNEGVTGLLRQMPGAVGYVELGYAMKNGLAVAAVENRAGRFIAPSIASVTAAAAGASHEIPDDFRASITDAAGDEAYPISAFTYMLLAQQQEDQAKGAALAGFLRWALTDGQLLAPPLFYAPLPAAIAERAMRAIDTANIPGGAPR